MRTEIFSGILGTFLGIFLVVVGVLYMILPFIMITIKNKLDEIVSLLNEQNENLPSRKRGEYQPQKKESILKRRIL